MSALEQTFRELAAEAKRINELGAAPLLGDKQLAQLVTYVELLQTWTTRVDLIAPATDEEVLAQHILDSYLALLRLESCCALASGPLLDVGSGAGLPGMVAAITNPSRQVDLAEPREKRVTFLKEVRRKLGLSNVAVLPTRIEDLSQETPEKYSVLMSRALGKDTLLLEHANFRLVKEGVIALMVGPSWRYQAHAEQELGLRFQGKFDYLLPHAGRRFLAIWSKR